MVGLVLVSHSKKLAEATRELVLQMTGPDFPIAVASGVGETHDELGTDAVHISEVLQSLDCPEGVLVLMDLGSAVLSAVTALELLDTPDKPIRLSPAPLIEGAVGAAVRAQAGGTLDEVAQEAELGLAPKQQQLQPESPASFSPPVTQPQTGMPGETVEFVLEIENPHGLHARPAAALVQIASRFASNIEVSNLTSGRGPVPARSLTSISLLQVRKGDRIKVVCNGNDCEQALQAIRDLAAAGFGDKLEPPPTTKAPVPQRSGTASGFPGSDGIAIGPLMLLQSAELEFEDQPTADPASESASLKLAIDAVRRQIQSANKDGNEILEAQAMILSDPLVVSKLEYRLQSDRVSAARAWVDVTRDLAGQYAAMDDAYLRERAADVRDIAQRVLRQISWCRLASAYRPQHAFGTVHGRVAPKRSLGLRPCESSGCDHRKG